MHFEKPCVVEDDQCATLLFGPGRSEKHSNIGEFGGLSQWHHLSNERKTLVVLGTHWITASSYVGII